MAVRRVTGLVALLVAVLVALAVTAPGHRSQAATAAPSTTVGAGPTTTMLDNPFLPEEVNLSDCISAVPKPGCGSSARGGWRQTLVFAVMALGLVLIAWRIVAGARRGRAAG